MPCVVFIDAQKLRLVPIERSDQLLPQLGASIERILEIKLLVGVTLARALAKPLGKQLA